MSASSGLGPVSAVTVTGSSAIPQIGQEPGPGCRISGCIGQVYSTVSYPGLSANGVGAVPGRWVWLFMHFTIPPRGM